MSRPSAGKRGYDARWRRRRGAYLRRNPTCRLCPSPSTVADHWPRSRRELLAAGVADPDADQHLRPLCKPCHDRETARNQPGGWNTKPRKRARPQHPGIVAPAGGGGRPTRPPAHDRGA